MMRLLRLTPERISVLMTVAVVVAVVPLLSAPLRAQVVMERHADGSVVITNQRRTSDRSRGSRSGVTVSPGVQVVEDGSNLARAAARRYATTPEIEAWITTWSTKANLDQELVKSLIAAESSFDADALSEKGAIGLMQLMPGTAADMGVRDPWDPESNIRGGTRYLRHLLDRFDQNLELALAAYNAGPGAVEANGGVPPYRETRNYVRKVLSRYRGKPIDLSGVRVASGNNRVRYRPIQTKRDENGRLVILTP